MRWWAIVTLAGALAFGQSDERQSWTLSGTVTDSAMGQPIAGAIVAWEPSFAGAGFHDRPVQNNPPPSDPRVPTDSAGKFTLSVDATATAVRLFVSHPRYRAEDGKPIAFLSIAAPASASEGAMQTIAIRLVPQAAIQGRVTDAAGDAIVNASVTAFRIAMVDGRRQVRQAFTRLTGQQGEFLFGDLPPGAYYARATGSSLVPGQAYGPVYYPEATSQNQGQLLRAAAGSAIVANFRLEGHQAYSIHGVVANLPVRRNITIRLLGGDDPLDSPVSIGSNGTFTITGVAPGSYTLQAYTPNIDPPAFGEVQVRVEERDAVGIKVALSEGVDVSGHIEFRGSGSLEKYAVLYATPFNPGRLPPDFKVPPVTMRSNGSFVFRYLLPAKYDMAVRGLPGTYLAEIHAESKDGSKDVIEQGLTVPAANPPTLSIVMKTGGGEINGTIEGATPGSAFIVALIMSRGAANIPAIFRAEGGRFHLAGLTPGDYTLLAWPETRGIEFRNPAILSALLPQGIALSLADGAHRSVELTPLH